VEVSGIRTCWFHTDPDDDDDDQEEATSTHRDMFFPGHEVLAAVSGSHAVFAASHTACAAWHAACSALCYGTLSDETHT